MRLRDSTAVVSALVLTGCGALLVAFGLARSPHPVAGLVQALSRVGANGDGGLGAALGCDVVSGRVDDDGQLADDRGVSACVADEEGQVP